MPDIYSPIMKVSNLKFAKRQSYILLFGLIITSSAVVICGWMIYNIFIIPLLLIFIYLFIVCKSTSIELSGGCFTIRKSHPLTFNRFITPYFELPYSRLLEYKMDKSFSTSKLILKVNSERKNKFILKISLRGFTSVQIVKLETSLATVFIPPDNSNSTIQRVA